MIILVSGNQIIQKQKLQKKAGEYTYKISDKDNKNTVTYENGVFDKNNNCVKFENEKYKDSFNYNSQSKSIKWIVKKGDNEYSATLKSIKKYRKSK